MWNDEYQWWDYAKVTEIYKYFFVFFMCSQKDITVEFAVNLKVVKIQIPVSVLKYLVVLIMYSLKRSLKKCPSIRIYKAFALNCMHGLSLISAKISS